MNENWKNLALVTGVVIVMAMFVSCAQDPKQAEEQQRSVIDSRSIVDSIGETITIGNHSWIPLDWNYSRTYSMVEGIGTFEVWNILSVMDCFELEKPWFDLIDWKLEVTHTSYSHNQRVYGIWVDHKLKPGYVKEYQADGYPTGRYIKQEE